MVARRLTKKKKKKGGGGGGGAVNLAIMDSLSICSSCLVVIFQNDALKTIWLHVKPSKV